MSEQTIFLLRDQPIIEINPELLREHELSKELFGETTSEEYEALKEDIKNRGIQDPLHVVKQNGGYLIVSGHRRAKIAKELDIKVPCIVRTDLKENWQIKEALIKDNLLRRHLTDYQKVRCGLELEPIERLKAKKRQVEAGKLFGEKHPKEDMQNFAQALSSEKGQTRDIVAKAVGFGSGWQYEKAKKVYEEAPEPIKKQWQEGKLSTHAAYQKVKRLEQIEKQKEAVGEIKPIEEIGGKFDIIYADPPWEYNFSVSDSRAIESHYPTMKLDEICKLKIPAAENAVLFLWVPQPKLREGLKVIDAWGFEYKTGMVWVKDRIGMGYYVRGKHELLLIATRGKPELPLPENRPESVIEAPRTNHSEKPKVIYDIIEKMYPNKRYLEMFARSQHDGWVAWGHENRNAEGEIRKRR